MIIFKDNILSTEKEKENAIIDIAYNKYIHAWLKSHGLSVLDIINELETLRKDLPYVADTPVTELYETFLYETGFGSNIYNTKKEFIREEFLDSGYMKELLTPEEYEVYKNFIVHTTESLRRKDSL